MSHLLTICGGSLSNDSSVVAAKFLSSGATALPPSHFFNHCKRPLREVGRISPIPQVHCQLPTIKVKPKIFDQIIATVEGEYCAHR